MTVTFYSNFFNDHQLPFCEEMYKLLGDGFTFVATEPISKERLAMGFEDKSRNYPFILNEYENEINSKKAYELRLSSDIVIVGSAPDLYLRDRVLNGKLTFRYSERFFKKGKWRILDPRVAFAHYKGSFRYRKFKNLYMLCASAYTSSDCRFIHSYPDRMYKWGYFTRANKHDMDILTHKVNDYVKILWAGRLIKWKHPEIPILIINKLIENDYKVKLDIIGNGQLENNLKHMVSKYNLSEYVNFLGSMSPDNVLKNMEKADIFLFTSDRQEGWGVVLNESMSSSCAVVANRSIGSVPFLIKNGENGLMYNGTTNDLLKKVESVVKDIDYCRRLGSNAYKTMHNEWSPEIAAERLVAFCKELLDGRVLNFDNGPMSKA
ncbi:MAG: glycosyltransferase [Clostridiaceae bacterium]